MQCESVCPRSRGFYGKLLIIFEFFFTKRMKISQGEFLLWFPWTKKEIVLQVSASSWCYGMESPGDIGFRNLNPSQDLGVKLLLMQSYTGIPADPLFSFL
jgi:hypothetical protein